MKSCFAGIAGLFLLAGCAGTWGVQFDEPLDPSVSRQWTVLDVAISARSDLTVSNDPNILAPAKDVVWYGDPPGNRVAQVAAILDQGITAGSRRASGPVPVTIAVTLQRFHAVTPAAIANAPSAVHNIVYTAQVFDARTSRPITEPQQIAADLDARVGAAAVVSAVEGQTQKARIIAHVAAVTEGWLGLGPDPRSEFAGLGR